MNEIWHSVVYPNDAANGGMTATACARAGSPWYAGHFPGEPILPGVAILAMVTDAVRRYEKEQGRDVRIAGIRRVRFKLPVRPDESLHISLSRVSGEKDLCYQFTVELSGKTVCMGIVVATPLRDAIGAAMTYSL